MELSNLAVAETLAWATVMSIIIIIVMSSCVVDVDDDAVDERGLAISASAALGPKSSGPRRCPPLWMQVVPLLVVAEREGMTTTLVRCIPK